MTNRKKFKTERKLKIVSKHQLRNRYEYIRVPEIKLVGKWLKDSGFKEGKYVCIKVQPKKLTITLKEEKADNTV